MAATSGRAVDFDEGDVVWDRRRRGVRRRVAAWEQKSRRFVGIGKTWAEGYHDAGGWCIVWWSAWSRVNNPQARNATKL